MRLAIVLAITAVLWALVVGGSVYLRRRIGRTPERERLDGLSRGLTWAQRWRVYRAVGRGRAVTDPALAPAAVARAQYVRAYGRRLLGSRWRWALAVIAVMQLLVAGLRLFAPGTSPPMRAVGVAAALMMAAVLGSIPWLWRFSGARVDRAELLNRALTPEEALHHAELIHRRA